MAVSALSPNLMISSGDIRSPDLAALDTKREAGSVE
jgi:hypothetical protein